MKHEEFHELLEKAIDIRCDIEELWNDLHAFWMDEANDELSQTLYYLMDKLDDLDVAASEAESEFNETYENWEY